MAFKLLLLRTHGCHWVACGKLQVAGVGSVSLVIYVHC